MAPPRKALIAVTSAHAPFYPEGRETTLHPFNVFRKSGFEVDFASETGTYKPDWLSLREDYLQGDDDGKTARASSDLDSIIYTKPGDIKAEQYGLFFAAGGHACLIDFPNAKGLQGIAAEIDSAGGIVSAVCHGPAILPGITDAKTGKSIIAGTKVTGFATKGKEELGALKTIKEKWNALAIEEATTEAGALYISPPAPFKAFATADGRRMTGANPASATTAAEGCLCLRNSRNSKVRKFEVMKSLL